MATFIIDMARLDPHIIRTNIDQISDLLTAEVRRTHLVQSHVVVCSPLEPSYSCRCADGILFGGRKAPLLRRSRRRPAEDARRSLANPTRRSTLRSFALVVITTF